MDGITSQIFAYHNTIKAVWFDASPIKDVYCQIGCIIKYIMNAFFIEIMSGGNGDPVDEIEPLISKLFSA